MNKAELSAKVSRLISGAPRGTITHTTGNFGRDEIGTVYFIQSAAQRETQRRIMRQKREGRKEAFFFSVMERMHYVASVLTPAQCGYLLVLTSHVDFDGQLIKSEKDPTPMTPACMQKTLKLTSTKRRTFYDFMDACLDHGIIKRKDDAYYIEQGFHFRGKTEGERVVRTYIAQLREMYKEVNAHDIGLLYRLLPFIHVDTNILCANPNEKNPSAVVKFNRKSLAEAIGVTPQVISRATSRMIYDGKSVFAKVSTATDGTFYMLNPSIFRRADRDDYDVTTRVIFGLN
ncbi:hypothetical protein V7149_00235 [Bacillus sp. JJ1503]|uniref:hypothetical protein n=1 Tax=Bacillus sp. JJ1503 TaxID=3122956 RepID=UPI003000BA35